MRERNGSSVGLIMIGIAAVFLAGFFLLVVFGAQSYKAAVAGRDANMSRRALQSYLSTTLKGFDREDAVSVVRDGVHGDVLVIADGSGYALHIYREGGELLEDYAPLGSELSAERAQVIGRTESFSVVELDGAICLYTDAGRVLLRLRSGGDEK